MQESPGATGVDSSYTSNVPAFLTKLWTLVEDPETNHLICWSAVSSTWSKAIPVCVCVFSSTAWNDICEHWATQSKDECVSLLHERYQSPSVSLTFPFFCFTNTTTTATSWGLCLRSTYWSLSYLVISLHNKFPEPHSGEARLVPGEELCSSICPSLHTSIRTLLISHPFTFQSLKTNCIVEHLQSGVT